MATYMDKTALFKLQEIDKFSAETANAIITTGLLVLGPDQYGFFLADTDSDMNKVGRIVDMKPDVISALPFFDNIAKVSITKLSMLMGLLQKSNPIDC